VTFLHAWLIDRNWTWHNKEKQVENGKDTDDFEIEITDIPQDEGRSVSIALLKLGSHFSPKSRVWRFSMVAGILSLVLLVLVSSFPSLLDTAWELFRKSPASGSSLTSRQLDVSANLLPAPLGPAPQNCPSIAHLHDFDLPTFPPGVGSSPVWVVGFSAPGARLVQLDRAVHQPRQEGWAYRMMLVVPSNYSGFVVLSGRSLQGNVPLRFNNGLSIATQDPVTTFFLLHTEHAKMPVRLSDAHWRAWNVPVYVPAAGCYYLKAAWAGGSWQVNFAAGRIDSP
jgi:hypothetical protein